MRTCPKANGHLKHININSSGTDTCAEKTHKVWACTSPQVFAVTLLATPLPAQAALCAGEAPLRQGVSAQGDSAPGSSESLGSRKGAWTKQIPRTDNTNNKAKNDSCHFRCLGVVHIHYSVNLPKDREKVSDEYSQHLEESSAAPRGFSSVPATAQTITDKARTVCSSLTQKAKLQMWHIRVLATNNEVCV